MSVGAHPRSSPHLDAASHLGTAFFLLVPVEIFCLYTAHMYSIVKRISGHLSPLDAVRRVHVWRLLLRPTHHATRAAPCSIPSLPTILRPFSPHSTPTPMLQACRRMWNVNFTPICSAASWPMAFSAWVVIRARKSCCCPSAASGAAFVRRGGPAHGPDRGPPRHVRHSLGTDAPMGRLGAGPLALLDGVFAGPHRQGPYHHSHHDRTVLCEPGSRPRL